MDVESVTLQEVLSAASIRAASLVPETSGYLALAVADASARLPFRLDDGLVTLTTEGTVKVARGNVIVPPRESAARVRDVLARLIGQSIGSAPALASASRPRPESDEGVDAFIQELETALVPVNRAAARRALARLARETVRARDAGKLRRRKSSKRSSIAPAPAAVPEAAARPSVRTAAVMHGPPAVVAAAPDPFEYGVDVDFTPPPPPAPAPAPAPVAAADPLEGLTPLEPAPTFDTVDPAEREAVAPSVAIQAQERVEDPTTIDAEVAPGPAVDPMVEAFSQGVKPRRSDVDDLLNRFNVSALTTPETIKDTRASLKRLAGLDPTPPPPTARELKRLTGRPATGKDLRDEPSAPAVGASVPEALRAGRAARSSAASLEPVEAVSAAKPVRWTSIALVSLGLILAALLGHYLPSLLHARPSTSNATP